MDVRLIRCAVASQSLRSEGRDLEAWCAGADWRVRAASTVAHSGSEVASQDRLWHFQVIFLLHYDTTFDRSLFFLLAADLYLLGRYNSRLFMPAAMDMVFGSNVKLGFLVLLFIVNGNLSKHLLYTMCCISSHLEAQLYLKAPHNLTGSEIVCYQADLVG